MDVATISPPNLTGLRPTPVLSEDRIGHYPEFRDFFRRSFDLDRVGLSAPGYLRAPSGLAYRLVFIGRSGEAFPAGVEIQALPQGLEPLDAAALDADLYAILGWMIAGVGGPWTPEAFTATARLYRVPAAG